MSAKTLLTGGFLVLLLMASRAQAQYWQGVNGPEDLIIDSFKVAILYEDTVTQIRGALTGRITGILDEPRAVNGFTICSLSVAIDDYFIDSLEALPDVKLVEPYYLTPHGYPLLVGSDFCVAFNEGVSRAVIDSINEVFGVAVQRTNLAKPNAYVLRNLGTSGFRLVELANVYYALDETEYSHPDFSADIQLDQYTLYDYYRDYQPHPKKVIGSFNTATVWDFAGTDRTVTVAVIDDGLTPHEDLPGIRILDGFDAAMNDSDVTPYPGSYHGYAVAGLIGASHTLEASEGALTSSGIISLNPHVNIVPVKIYNDFGNSGGLSVSVLEDAIDFAWAWAGADILNNSWSFRDPETPGFPNLEWALTAAYALGREQLGSPVIFSSGDITATYPDPVPLRYPARYIDCFAVGASRLFDTRWDYSCYGPGLDMVAPSDDGYTVGVWTLDQMGYLGINPGGMADCPPGANDIDYNCHFGGTSASAAIVSGAFSLLMSYDPTLWSSEYIDIIRNSAVKDLAWGTLPDTPDVQYGYGRVDAFRAVLSLARGDCNNDGAVDNSDVTKLVNHLFVTYEHLFPTDLLGDVNCDGDVDIQDMTRLVNHLFVTFEPLAIPCYNYDNADW